MDWLKLIFIETLLHFIIQEIKNHSQDIKIWRLKCKLKRTILQYYAIFDEYDCGITLAEYISPRLYRLRQEIDELNNILIKIDFNHPHYRKNTNA